MRNKTSSKRQDEECSRNLVFTELDFFSTEVLKLLNGYYLQSVSVPLAKMEEDNMLILHEINGTNL